MGSFEFCYWENLGVGPSWVGVGHPLFVVREAGRAIRGWGPLPHTGKNNTLATIERHKYISSHEYIISSNMGVGTSPTRLTQYQLIRK